VAEASRALKKDYAFDDPLEAAMFSVLVEMMMELEKKMWI
jgi:hypothetical protein